MRKSADQALPSLSRRTFVAAAATTGAAAALGLSGAAPKARHGGRRRRPMPRVRRRTPYADAQVFYSTCRPSASTTT